MLVNFFLIKYLTSCFNYYVKGLQASSTSTLVDKLWYLTNLVSVKTRHFLEQFDTTLQLFKKKTSNDNNLTVYKPSAMTPLVFAFRVCYH